MTRSKCANCNGLLPPTDDAFCTFCHEALVHPSSMPDAEPSHAINGDSENPYASPSSLGLRANDSNKYGKWITNISATYLVLAPVFSVVLIQLLGEETSILSLMIRTSLCLLFAFAIWNRINSARLFVAIIGILLAILLAFATIRNGVRLTLAFSGAWILIGGAGLVGIGLLSPAAKRYFRAKHAE